METELSGSSASKVVKSGSFKALLDPSNLDPKQHPTSQSVLKQQRMAIWRPKWKPVWVIAFYFIMALVYTGLGAVQLLWDGNIFQAEIRYDNLPECDISKGGSSKKCTVTLDITRDVQPPLFLYYKLENFYGNHRNFVMDREWKQLANKYAAGSESYNKCGAAKQFDNRYNVSTKFTAAQTNTPYLYPCGLVAQSFFTDTFPAACAYNTTTAGCTNLTGDNWDNTEISWKWDRTLKFTARDPLPSETRQNMFRDFQMPKVDDENFIVWMRMSSFPWLWKLSRRIMHKFNAGEQLKVDIVNNYPAHEFEGKKYLVLTSMSSVGGKTQFLSIVYLVIGVTCIMLTLVVWWKARGNIHKVARSSSM